MFEKITVRNIADNIMDTYYGGHVKTEKGIAIENFILYVLQAKGIMLKKRFLEARALTQSGVSPDIQNYSTYVKFNKEQFVGNSEYTVLKLEKEVADFPNGYGVVNLRSGCNMKFTRIRVGEIQLLNTNDYEGQILFVPYTDRIVFYLLNNTCISTLEADLILINNSPNEDAGDATILTEDAGEITEIVFKQVLPTKNIQADKINDENPNVAQQSANSKPNPLAQ